MRVWNFDVFFYGIQGFLVIVANVGLLWVALIFWQDGKLTVGDLVMIQSYIFGIFNQTWSIGREFRTIYTALADAGEMIAMIQTPYEIKDKKGVKHLAVDGGEVWFDDVSFKFHDATPVLHQFNLTIAGGERVALVGPSENKRN